MNTMIMKRGLSLAIIAAFAPVSGVQAAGEESQPTIVEVAQSAGIFNTLLAAAGAADLVGVINNEVPKTVFAPTDAAFAALPEGTVESLLLPENVDTLRNILLFHAHAGGVYSSGLKAGWLSMANGGSVEVSLANGPALVFEGGRSGIVAADGVASNGVIHKLDAVLLPSSTNIADTLVGDPRFSTLVAAASAAGVVDALAGLKGYTLFAPTDEAFAKLPAGTVEFLLKPENLQTLQSILLLHVSEGKRSGGDLLAGATPTLGGQDLMVHYSGGHLMIGDHAVITRTEIPVWNGVIHVIDTVLLP